jgi:glutaredoxin
VTVLTLYTRPGCHLCDEAREAIGALRGELGPFELREVDIDSDDALLTAYLERIPVVEVDGVIISELVLDPDELRATVGLERE